MLASFCALTFRLDDQQHQTGGSTRSRPSSRVENDVGFARNDTDGHSPVQRDRVSQGRCSERPLHAIVFAPAYVAAVLATLLVVSCRANAQLSCDQPVDAPLGTSQAAALLAFPALQIVDPCAGPQTIHHAVYHSFTAPEDGWYSFHIVPTDTAPWSAKVAILDGCDPATQTAQLCRPTSGRILCSSGNFDLRPFASGTVQLNAGETRVLAIGGNSEQDGGSAQVRIARLGATPMEGAQPLTVGSNSFTITGYEPWISQGANPCDGRIYASDRFTFTPSESGSYRFGFCGTSRANIALSTSPFVVADDIVRAQGGCSNSGGRLTATLNAGTTYYIVAGSDFPYDFCGTRIADVQYIDPCPADYDESGLVNGADLAILLDNWGTSESDITGDGVADGVDLSILLGTWGACP